MSNLHPVRIMQYKQVIHYGPLLAGIHLARVAVNILDAIVRLGQYGTRR